MIADFADYQNEKLLKYTPFGGTEDTYTVLDYEISSEQYAVGFASGNTELRDQVNEILLEMNEDGTFAEISEKWFGTDVSILGK